jgi:hypothetical protein
MTFRIYFDSNSGDKLGRYDLGIPGSLKDIEPIQAQLRVGLHVILYQPGELEVEAVLDYSQEHRRWMASPIWSTLKHLP